MKIYIDKTFRISDDSSYHWQLESGDAGTVEFSYWEESVTGGLVKVNSMEFPSCYAESFGKLLLEQFTED